MITNTIHCFVTAPTFWNLSHLILWKFSQPTQGSSVVSEMPWEPITTWVPTEGLSKVRKVLTKGLTKGNGLNTTTTTTATTLLLICHVTRRHASCILLALLWNIHIDIFLPRTITSFNFLNPILKILRLLQKRFGFYWEKCNSRALSLWQAANSKYAHWTSQVKDLASPRGRKLYHQQFFLPILLHDKAHMDANKLILLWKSKLHLAVNLQELQTEKMWLWATKQAGKIPTWMPVIKPNHLLG